MTYSYWVSQEKGLNAQVLVRTWVHKFSNSSSHDFISYELWDPQWHPAPGTKNPTSTGFWQHFPKDRYRQISKDQFDAMMHLTVTSRK